MELRHLRYFEAVVAAGNVTRAAAALGLSQPSLSQALKEMEEELGVTLLDRGPRGSVLTPAGREFTKHASEMLERMTLARDATRRAAQGVAGQLVVAFTGSSVFDLLPLLMRAARAELPAVSLQLVEMLTDRQVDALYARQVDVALGRWLGTTPGLVSQVVARRSFVVALPVQHRLVRQREVSLSDLEGETLITPQRRLGPSFHSQLMSLLSKAKLGLSLVHEAVHMPVVPGLVAAGMGVGIVSDELRHLEVRDVVYRPLKEGRQAVQLALSWRQDNDTPWVRKFVELGRHALKQEQEHDQ